jgi:hypothetical protein
LPSVVRTQENCWPVASAELTAGVLGKDGATESLPHASAPTSIVATIDAVARRMMLVGWGD